MSESEQKWIFSQNLLRLLDISGKIQKEVADSIGVSPQTMNTWCRGIALPRMDKVQLLANYFGVKKSDLLEEKREKSSYYLSEEADEAAQFLFNNPEYKVLFDASKKVKQEDIQFVADLIERMSNK